MYVSVSIYPERPHISLRTIAMFAFLKWLLKTIIQGLMERFVVSALMSI